MMIVSDKRNRLIENFQDLQTRAQPARLEILSLLNKLMAEHRKSIKSLGSESLIGITDLVSGEKDPRNLMVVFSILRVIMLEWEIEDHAEVRPRAKPLELLLTCKDSFRISILLLSNHI